MSERDIPKSHFAKEKGVFEKRRGEMPVPLNVRHMLNEDQNNALQHMASFGWRLAFVRRQKDDALVVVRNSHMKSLGLLCKDGSIDTNSDISIRSERL